MAQDCANASNTAGLDFDDFMGIDMHFNEDMTYSWGGSVYLSLDGVSRIWKATWMSDWGVAGVQAHEMGHGFGLLHSSGPYDADVRLPLGSDELRVCRPAGRHLRLDAGRHDLLSP